jgi:predicted dehydrogenase
MRPVRVALLGCGAIATAVHLRVLMHLETAEVVALADPDPAARDRARHLAGVEPTADPWSVVGRPDVDAVVVTTPSATHAELAAAAAAAGKHLYVEKPLATSREDGRRVVDAVDAAGVVAAIGFNRRFHPVFRRARELLRRNEIGHPVAVQSAFGQRLDDVPGWKRSRATGGGAVLDLASHHADLLRWLLGDVVEAQAWTASERSEDDRATIRWRLENGVEAQTSVSFRVAQVDVLQVIGEDGVLRADRYLPTVDVWRTRRRRPARRRLVPSTELVAWRARRVLGRGDPSFGLALEAWVDAVRGRPVELPGMADGLASLEAVLAAEESARRGGMTVRLAEYGPTAQHATIDPG